jgi:hypothetical protein
MKNPVTRLPALPLITHDPFFSIWDPNYTPTGGETRHWCGSEKRLLANIDVDGQKMRFLGTGGNPAMPRKRVDLTPLSTKYTYEGLGVRLTVTFTSPLLLDDLDILSTPITYVTFGVEAMDGKPHTATITFNGNETLVYSGEKGPKMRSDSFSDELLHYGYLGQMKQNPLSGSGDHLTIDWGYLFFAAKDGVCENNPKLIANTMSYRVTKEVPFESTLMVGYDDVACINDFGALLPA